MRGSKTIQFIVEGGSEKKLLQCIGVKGKIKEFNMVEKSFEKIEKTFSKETTFFVIFDVDVLKSIPKTQHIFCKNLERLRINKGFKVFLLQQTDNFEDELVTASEKIKNIANLFSLFEASNSKEFKTLFCQSTNPIHKLASVEFKKEVLWTGELLEILEKFRSHKIGFAELTKLVTIIDD